MTRFQFLTLLGLGSILSFTLRLWAFQQSDFATGWDSYFYLIQLKSLLEEGNMHSTDRSLIYPFMYFIKVIMTDYELTFKVSAALLSAFFTLNAGLLTQKITKKMPLALVAVAFTLFSPHLSYFAAQYPKNLLGLNFFLLLVSQTPSLFENTTTKRQWLLCAGLVLLNLFGHRMTMVLSLLFLALAVVVQQLPTKWLVITILSFLGILGIGILLPGILSFADISRFENLLSSTPQWALYSFWESFGAARISTAWRIELGTLGTAWFALLAFALIELRTSLKKTSLIWALLCLVLIFPFFKWSLDGIAYRLFLAYVLLMPFGMWMLLGKWHLFGKRNWTYILLSVLLIGCSYFSKSGYQSKQHDPPYHLYQQVTKRSLQQLDSTTVELIIAHKSLAEYFTFVSGIDALPWLPEYPIEKEKLWRIATDLNPNEFQYLMPAANCHRLSSNYFLIREDQWQLFLQKLEKASGKAALVPLLTWKNPYKIRPYYLLKNKAE